MPDASGIRARARMTKVENAKKSPAFIPLPSTQSDTVYPSLIDASNDRERCSLTTTVHHIAQFSDAPCSDVHFPCSNVQPLWTPEHGPAHTPTVKNTAIWSSGDPLGEALYLLRMSGAFYCRSDLGAPWGLGIPAMDGCLWFHVVTSGACTLALDDGCESLPLVPGDLAVVPHGRGHRLVSEHGVETPSVASLPQEMVTERYSVLAHGGRGARTTLVCGALRADDPATRKLFGALPSVIHLPAAAAYDMGVVASTLRLIAEEARTRRPGGETVITRLGDVLVVHAIRTWLARTENEASGFVAALRDAHVGRALALVRRDAAHPWTIASLASAVGMSRSAFAARFSELVGEPPMQYVTRLRMERAEVELTHTDVGVSALAGRMGYQSEAAFSRAFKRFAGVSPGAYKRNAQGSEP